MSKVQQSLRVHELRKRLAEFHEYLKREAVYSGNPYAGVLESEVDEARFEARKEILDDFESRFCLEGEKE